jgi:hypothetical protein
MTAASFATVVPLGVADKMGHIDAALAIAGDGGPEITGEGQHRSRVVGGVDRDQDHRIGAGGARLIWALVDSQEQDIDALFFHDHVRQLVFIQTSPQRLRIDDIVEERHS